MLLLMMKSIGLILRQKLVLSVQNAGSKNFDFLQPGSYGISPGLLASQNNRSPMSGHYQALPLSLFPPLPSLGKAGT